MKLRQFALTAFLVAFALTVPRTVPPSPVAVTAHEWGTFTSIAAPDGTPMDWLPLAASSGLPNFVEHLHNANFKGGLRGTIRMETPVLYFYSPQETTVSVNVAFSQGLITEWYPHADVPAISPSRLFEVDQKQRNGMISWGSVEIDPATSADFPVEAPNNPYYAARETSAASLAVSTASGSQHEKFLFYRGVSTMLPALFAAIAPDGTISIFGKWGLPPARNVSEKGAASAPEVIAEIPNAILFERRGNNIGFRILGPMADEATFAAPTLDGSLDSLFSDLEGMLIAQGLFPDEARAMLETWESSWFEEGSRILYIVPRSFVDSVLPLTITPAPAQLTRVFIGRLELITPATQEEVISAFAANDRATLAKYNRFLEPILRTMLAAAPDQPARARLSAYLVSVYSDFYSQPHD